MPRTAHVQGDNKQTKSTYRVNDGGDDDNDDDDDDDDDDDNNNNNNNNGTPHIIRKVLQCEA